MEIEDQFYVDLSQRRSPGLSRRTHKNLYETINMG